MNNTYYKAIELIKKLTREGFCAYFAGGWVRDFLLGHPSDDIDIATDAPPQVILDLFTRTIPVGLSFGVVIVAVEGHQFEVATFRRDISYSNGRQPDQVELSTPLEDALRRDFTINGMFYDPLNATIYDYVGGRDDLQSGLIRTIGNPQERFHEDRLRMIRAVRFAARFGFNIDPATQEAIQETSESLFPAVAMERVWQEFTKMARSPGLDHALLTLQRLHLLPVIFPSLRNVSLETIEERATPLARFPKDAPAVLALAHLFPDVGTAALLDIATALRMSNGDKRWICSWQQFKDLAQDEGQGISVSREAWTRCYADLQSHLCQTLLSQKLAGDQAAKFNLCHEERRLLLAKHITRLRENKPLLTASRLQELGFLPGIAMGKLLKQAEILAIEADIDDTDLLLEHMGIKL